MPRLCGGHAGSFGTWRLAGRANIESVWDPDVDMLVGRLGHTTADDGEVLLLVTARRVGVDEGGFTRLQIAVTDDAFFDFLRCHELFLSFGWGQKVKDRCPGGRRFSRRTLRLAR